MVLVSVEWMLTQQFLHCKVVTNVLPEFTDVVQGIIWSLILHPELGLIQNHLTVLVVRFLHRDQRQDSI